jgi:hypothetical protein
MLLNRNESLTISAVQNIQTPKATLNSGECCQTPSLKSNGTQCQVRKRADVDAKQTSLSNVTVALVFYVINSIMLL